MAIEPSCKNCSRRNKENRCRRKPGEYICLNWSGDIKVIREQERESREKEESEEEPE